MSIVFEKKFQKILCPTYTAVFQRYKSGINNEIILHNKKKPNHGSKPSVRKCHLWAEIDLASSVVYHNR